MEKFTPSDSTNPRQASNYKPLSELTLSSPSPLSFKSFTSRARDIYFHLYVNEPALFTIEIPDSYPSPITLLLQARSPTARTVKATIARCIPAPAPAEKWEMVVPIEGSVNPVKDIGEAGGEGSQSTERRIKMERIGKDFYSLAAPWIHKESSNTFQWHRLSTTTKTNGQNPVPTSFTNPDWKLINVSTQEVHAVFVEQWGATERGQIQFRRSFGREWELSVVLSVGLIVEQGRRRKGRRGNFLGGIGAGGVGAASGQI